MVRDDDMTKHGAPLERAIDGYILSVMLIWLEELTCSTEPDIDLLFRELL